MIKSVIFDFDETLALTEEACFYLENEVAQEMGFAPMTREMHKSNWGMNLREIISTRIPGINVEEFITRQERKFLEYLKAGKLDNISETNLMVLDELRERGIKLGVITNRSFAEVKHLIDKNHPIGSRMEAFYHRNNSDFFKPDPRVFNKILRDFDLSSSECVYVGDSVSDAQAAIGNGLKFIAYMESGLRTKEDFKDYPVDLFAKSFSEILDFVFKN